MTFISGNYYNKYDSKNPIEQMLVKGFENRIFSIIDKVNPTNVFEIGCGEGFWLKALALREIYVEGFDVSDECVEIAKKMASSLSSDYLQEKNIKRFSAETFDYSSIKKANLVLMLEVLEHTNDPELILKKIAANIPKNKTIIFSVPREPIWRILNIMRLKYIGDLGNTPGHFQHWNTRTFSKFISKYFTVKNVYKPIPWTIVEAEK